MLSWIEVDETLSVSTKRELVFEELKNRKRKATNDIEVK